MLANLHINSFEQKLLEKGLGRLVGGEELGAGNKGNLCHLKLGVG